MRRDARNPPRRRLSLRAFRHPKELSMKTRSAAVLAAGLFAAGLGLGIAYAKQQTIDPAVYHGRSKQEAAKALLDLARMQAEDGSWERIAVGRVYYLGGYKSEGQAIFDAVLGGKHEASDEMRVARVYREAGEWAKARPLFDKYVAANPKDEKEIAEIGAYYLMNGDRAAAEKLFERSFAIEPELWATLAAAGAYLGVAPQE
jgi:tetratricopeptide (TPR) repeat protein